MNPIESDIARIGDVLEAALARRPARRAAGSAVRPIAAAALIVLLLGAGAVAAPRARDIVGNAIERLLGDDSGTGLRAADVPDWIADARAGLLPDATARELARDGDQRVVAFRDAERGWCVTYGDTAVDCDPTPDLALFRRELAHDGFILRGPYDGAPRAQLHVDRINRSPGTVLYVLAPPAVARIRVRYANHRPIERATPNGAAVVRTRGARALAVDALNAAGDVVATRHVPTFDPSPAGPRRTPTEAFGVLRRPQQPGDRRDIRQLIEIGRIVLDDPVPDAAPPGAIDPTSARSVEVGGGVISMARTTSGTLIVSKRDAREHEGGATVIVDVPAGRPWNLAYGWDGATYSSDFVIAGLVADDVVRLTARFGLQTVDAPIRENALYLRIRAATLHARYPDEITATLRDGTTITGLF